MVGEGKESFNEGIQRVLHQSPLLCEQLPRSEAHRGTVTLSKCVRTGPNRSAFVGCCCGVWNFTITFRS